MTKKYEKDLLLWIGILTFTGAFLNTISLIKYSMPISHITGTFNTSFQNLAKSNLYGFFSTFQIVLSFLIGTIISGIVFPETKFVFKKKYEIYLLVLGASLAIATYLFHEKHFFIDILSLITGMQNGMLIQSKSGVCRTTHITGTLTDLGIQIGKYFLKKSDPIKSKLVFFQIFMVILGTTFSIKLFILFSVNAFYFASISYFLSAFICYKIRNKYDIETLENS